MNSTAAPSTSASILEPARSLPIRGRYDVIVCGAGPAGISAAIAAARTGARTALIESQGCLGGVWTSGLLSYILDAKNKPGLIDELHVRLRKLGALGEQRDLYDAEAMKLVLDEMCGESGVEIWLYARLVAAISGANRIQQIVIEAKEGRFALEADVFIDTTGDGDLGAFAGCGFDMGRPGDGGTQPMTLMALVSNVPESVRTAPFASAGSGSCVNKDEFYKNLSAAGVVPSYSKPSLFPLPNGLCCLMANHEYGKSGLDSQDLTRASISARRELRRVVEALRRFGPEWKQVELVATGAHIGVREGRRIHGRYTVSVDDILTGAVHADAVTKTTFGVDIHSVKSTEGGGYSGVDGKQHPYDIPARALMSRDRENLLMAGRCISGDFYAHASYRVTGNSVATGEGAGVLAASAVQGRRLAAEVDATEFLKKLKDFRDDAASRTA